VGLVILGWALMGDEHLDPRHHRTGDVGGDDRAGFSVGLVFNPMT